MPIDLDKPMTQEQFAALVGVSQQAVSDLVTRETLRRDGNAHEWVLTYCANLREQAAGRAANGDIQLATERALLAREQRRRIELDIAVKQREMAPVAVLEVALANISRQVATILEALPIKLRRQSDKLTAEDIALIDREIVLARNLAATASLNLEELDGLAGDPAGDSRRAEAA